MDTNLQMNGNKLKLKIYYEINKKNEGNFLVFISNKKQIFGVRETK